jgi:hypothetical protein
MIVLDGQVWPVRADDRPALAAVVPFMPERRIILPAGLDGR